METPRHEPVELYEFLYSQFAPRKLRGTASRYLPEFETAVGCLRAALQRMPLTSDLNTANIKRMRAIMRCEGVSRANSRKTIARISSLWRFAETRGLESDLRQATALHQGRRRARQNAGPGTLTHAYRTQFRSQQLGEKSISYVQAFDTAVNRFDAFRDRPVAIDEIDERLIKEFTSWLRQCGKPRHRIRHHEYCLRVLVDFVAPRRLSRRTRETKTAAPVSGSVWHFFEATYRPSNLVGSETNTVAEYRTTFRHMRKYFERDVLLSELSDAIAADFFAWRLSRGAARRTVNKHRGHLFAVWRHACELQRVKEFPRGKKLREPREEPEAWTEEEAAEMVAATGKLPEFPLIQGISRPDFWRALFLTVWWTGLRRGSLLALRWQDLDLTTGWIDARANAMKNRKGKRFRLGTDAIEALKAIQHPERELIFPWPHDMKVFSRHFREIQELAGLPNGRRRSLNQMHKWRRTVATVLAARHGINVAADMLGHSSVEITKRYVDCSKLPGHDATKMLPMIGSNGKDQQR